MRRALHLLGVLSDSDVSWMGENAQKRFAVPGEIVVTEGQPIGSLLVLIEGRMRVTTRAAGTKEIASLGSGDIVGEISLLDSRPPTATVTATSNCCYLAIPREKLLHRLASDQGFAARMYRALALFLVDRLRNTVGMLGYGRNHVEQDFSEMLEDDVEQVSMAAIRFDGLLRQTRQAGLD